LFSSCEEGVAVWHAVPVSKPKRHHYVPRAYLARFGRDDRVAIRWRGQQQVIVTATRNVAVESGLYTDKFGDGSTSVQTEEHLAVTDGHADSIIRRIVDEETIPDGTTERNTLGTYLEVQASRTPADRRLERAYDEVQAHADGRDIDAAVVRGYLRDIYLGFDPDDDEVQGFLTMAKMAAKLDPEELKRETQNFGNRFVRNIDEDHTSVTGLYLDKHWSLEISRKPLFITSDQPVVFSMPTSRKMTQCNCRFHADEIRFPVSPRHQLVLSSEPRPVVHRVNQRRVMRCNASQAAKCDRFIVGHPNRPAQLQQMVLASRGPVMRFSRTPGLTAEAEASIDATAPNAVHVYMWRENAAPSTPTTRSTTPRRRR
jgi:Protein of unknown function (DUF4238)